MKWNDLSKAEESDLVNLYHLARTPLAGQRDADGRLTDTRYNRMRLAAKWFHDAHPEVSETGAYKALDRALS